MQGSTFFTEGLFSVVSLLFCSLTGVVILLFSAKSQSRLCLGFFYLALSYGFTMAAMYYGGLINEYPHFYRTGNICWLMCMPLSWLYVRTTVTHKTLKAADLVHLLPVLLYILDYFPFFVLPAQTKARIFQIDMAHLHKMFRYGQGWLLPQNSQFLIRYFQMIVYLSLQLKLLFSRSALPIRKDKPMFHWLVAFTVLQIMLLTPFVSFLFTGLRQNAWISIISPTAILALSTVTLMLNPGILYGRRTFPVTPAPVQHKHLPDFDTSCEIAARLERLMREHKPFLHPHYTIKELAEAIDVTSHKLSAYMNQVAGASFTDYINRQRIQYCVEMMKNGATGNLNLNGIAAKCGFNNRQTFSTAFKKVTGAVPSAYLNETADS